MAGAVTAAPVTAALAERYTRLQLDEVPDEVREIAKQSLLDWLGVALAGSGEPVARMVRDEACAVGGVEQASLIGTSRQVTIDQAVLVNGTAGHALDYDDVLTATHTHSTAPVAPVVFALGELLGSSGRDILAAFVAGVELQAHVGLALGPSHYADGWHATATLGTFGAAMAASRLLGLSPERVTHALGLAGAQAAGSQSMFGTMGKSFQVARAAAAGALAARLAARGFVSRGDVVECESGVVDLYATDRDGIARSVDAVDTFLSRDTLYKYHAACYGTHAALEAARRLGAELAAAGGVDAIERVEITIADGLLALCDIAVPKTGLEAKFSVRFATVLGLLGYDTTSPATFSSEVVTDPRAVELARRTTVTGDARCGRFTAAINLGLTGGGRIDSVADVSTPEPRLDVQWQRIGEKFSALTASLIGAQRSAEVIATCRTLDEHPDVAGLLAGLCTGAAAPVR